MTEEIELTISVPRPKFKVGNIVKISQDYTHLANGYLVIGVVERVEFYGKWEHVNGKSAITLDYDNSGYWVACQHGSLTTNGKPIRSGQIIGFSVDDLNDFGELVAFGGELIKGDDPDNIFERLDAWEKQRNDHTTSTSSS